MRIQGKAFDIGRAIGKHPVASRLFCLVERALPLNRLARAGRVVAFRHPRPSYDPHILIVPTTPFPTIATSSLTITCKSGLLWEMTVLARQLAGPSEPDWQMVINGGERQDIGQVHGHLIHANGAAAGPTWALGDPGSTPDGWNSLFECVHRAARVSSNGYSVTFRFDSEDRLSATLSESIRP